MAGRRRRARHSKASNKTKHLALNDETVDQSHHIRYAGTPAMRDQPLFSLWRMLLGVAAIGCLWSGTARADLPVIIIDEQGLPYNLNPANFSNSPGNFSNSPANFANSEANFANSPANFANSSANYANGSSGQRKLVNEKNEFIGYYVFTDNNLMNLYNASGKRIGYIPGGGQTSGVFSEDGWCGTLGRNNSRTVLGLSVPCYRRFFLR
jgi:hypothetical protein